MRFRVFTEPQQGASFEQQLAMAQSTERLGFDGWFRSDHFLAMGGDGCPVRPTRGSRSARSRVRRRRSGSARS